MMLPKQRNQGSRAEKVAAELPSKVSRRANEIRTSSNRGIKIRGLRFFSFDGSKKKQTVPGEDSGVNVQL